MANLGVTLHLHTVAAAWTNPERLCRRLLVTEAGARLLAAPLAAAGVASRPAPEIVERARIDRLLPPGAVHQGVALEVEPLPPVDLDDLGRAASVRGRGVVLVLDRITDPHNVGAILRSAAAFGALGVVVTDRHAPPPTGTLAKAASGALETVPLVRVTNLAAALDRLADWEIAPIGLHQTGDAVLGLVALPRRLALVLGAEGEGLRALTRQRCRQLVRLDTSTALASLNVSNAAAVALYEADRQRRDGASDGAAPADLPQAAG